MEVSQVRIRLIGTKNLIFQFFSSSLIQLAVFNVIAMGLTNASVGYMNYPTQLMFKSCKVISVMAAGIVLKGNFIDFFTINTKLAILSNFLL